MSFCAINDLNTKKLMVIWDLGRRCTFSCSYCPPHRKNNWSSMASFDDLCKTADALERYSNIYNSKRSEPFKVSTSFTGGEPTVNPEFFKFLEYLQKKYPHWHKTLTTNGFYTTRKLETVMKNTAFTTVSYHCESTEDQKYQVRKNLQTMLDNGYNFKINIMFHENSSYFNECIELAKWCDDNSVQYTPRIIGDEEDVKEGLKEKTIHIYDEYQISWMKRYWNAKKQGAKNPAYIACTVEDKLDVNGIEPKKKIIGQTIGRPCCGNREMELLSNDTWSKSTFVESNNFQGWNCMINWYFLYIHQEIDKIWHHQTCQVNLEGKIGPICNVSDFDDYCNKLESQFETGLIPFIRCPKTHCGCGLCVPKAKDNELAKFIFSSHAPNITPVQMSQQENTYAGTLKSLVYKFDKENNNETI